MCSDRRRGRPERRATRTEGVTSPNMVGRLPLPSILRHPPSRDRSGPSTSRPLPAAASTLTSRPLLVTRRRRLAMPASSASSTAGWTGRRSPWVLTLSSSAAWTALSLPSAAAAAPAAAAPAAAPLGSGEAPFPIGGVNSSSSKSSSRGLRRPPAEGASQEVAAGPSTSQIIDDYAKKTYPLKVRRP